jgi:hypothetical protein
MSRRQRVLVLILSGLIAAIGPAALCLVKPGVTDGHSGPSYDSYPVDPMCFRMAVHNVEWRLMQLSDGLLGSWLNDLIDWAWESANWASPMPAN